MSVAVASGQLRVRVPASTSNLGAGFDCIGLAMDRYLTATYTPGGTGLAVEHCRGAVPGAAPATDLVALAFTRRLEERWGVEAAGLLRIDSGIPLGRGLGSSAAAVAAGLALADALATGRAPEAADLLAPAVAWEGHADNVAAALLGGLVATAGGADDPHAFRMPLSSRIGFGFAAPVAEVSTQAARRVLPESVAYATSIRALGRVAALLHGLATADEEAIRIGFEDELHVPYRLPLIPGGAAAMSAAREAGAWAATISGSGSGIIAPCAPHRASPVAEAMAAAFREAGEEATAFALHPDLRGLQLELDAGVPAGVVA